MREIPFKVEILFTICVFSCNLHLGYQSDETNLSTVELIQKYGYPDETHEVETKDGYILKLYRIPHGKSSNSTKQVPILLQHEMLASSDEYLVLQNESLAFLLANDGYDVWLGNFRGNKYTLTHKTLSSKNPKFWNFSLSISVFWWHEYGIYDLTATIDYICNHTGQNDILFIGHSVGCTAFFVMASERPEYQKKIRGGIMMAPVATVKDTKTILRFFAPFSYLAEIGRKVLPIGEIGLNNPEFTKLVTGACAIIRETHLCENSIYSVVGNSFNESGIDLFLNHYSSSTSLKLFAHYGETFVSGKFEQYDYGLLKNWKKYHRPSPPAYDLKSIKTPLSLILAPNDFFVPKAALQYLLERLTCVKNVYVVPDRRFGHIDFTIANISKNLVNKKVLQQVKFLINKGKDAESIKNFDNVYKKINF